MTSSPPSSNVLTALQALIDTVAQLRSPEGGCPWDLAQTPQSLIPYVIEEAYEVVDALRQDNPGDIEDELGDLLLQVVLQAQIASEMERFTLQGVAEAITRKLIRRHPHVFGEATSHESEVAADGVVVGEGAVASVDQVRQNWEAIKAEESERDQGDRRLTPRLAKYARSLPPLLASFKISKKAAGAGFEWESVDGVWDKFHEELGEFEQALKHESKARQQSEIGDLLFTVVNLARWYGLDPSAALQGTNERFVRRFAQVEAAAGESLEGYSIDDLERFWQAAKANDSVKSEE